MDKDLLEEMTKPRYKGIDGFFAALTVILLLVAIPAVVIAWRAAF